MKRKLINSQLCNYMTTLSYTKRMISLAENVFQFKNMPEFIDTAYVNQKLLFNGSIAFFKDEVMGVLALPYRPVGELDVYGRPIKIQVMGKNGYIKNCDIGEFVIMYDNEGHYPLIDDVRQAAERIALVKRTTDINIAQQKTPRIIKTSQEKEQTVKDLFNNVDGFETGIVTYNNIDLEDTSMVLAPAPYVADKLDLHKENEWSEFLSLIGVANLSVQKKERNITDEVQAMMGGTIASRYSRFEPRRKAIEQINNKFGTNIEVEFYDGLPTTLESEMISDDVSMDDVSDNVSEV